MAASSTDRLDALEQQQKKILAVLEGMKNLLDEHLAPLEIPRPSEWEPIVRKIGDNKRISPDEYGILVKFTDSKAYTKLEDICGSIKENFRRMIRKNMKGTGTKKKLDYVFFSWEETMRHLEGISKTTTDLQYQHYFATAILPFIESQQPNKV